MAKKYQKKESGGCPEWMATYGDMMTLLLCFFIMLFATSTVDAAKFEKLQQAFNPDAILENSGGATILGQENTNDEIISTLEKEIEYQEELSVLEKQLDEYVKENNLENSMTVTKNKDGIVLSLNSSMMFNSASAKLLATAKKHIQDIAKTLPKEFDIQIEGHTDNLPISNAEFEDNWELSTKRALTVLRFITVDCKFDSKKISAAGYGETRPVFDNGTEEGRSKNRRVDIIMKK